MTIPDCVLYLPAGGVLKSNNTALTRWVDQNTVNIAAASGAGATFQTGQINSLPAISFPGTSAGRYSLQFGASILSQVTDQQGGTHNHNSMIAELSIYNRVLTTTEIGTVETYLNGKYGT